MNLRVLAGPAVEPITLAEAKLHLRLDSSDEDSLVSGLITAARTHVERFTNRVMIYTAFRLTLDTFPYEIELPRSLAVEAAANTVTGIGYKTPRIQYYDEDDDQQTLTYDADDFELLLANNPPLLVLPALGTWPVTYTGQRGAVEVDFIAGYGATAASVPADIKVAMRMLIGHWFESREAVVTGTIATTIPLAVESILMMYRDGSMT